VLFRRNAAHRRAHLTSRWLLAGAIAALSLAASAKGQFAPSPVYTEMPPGGMNAPLAPPMQPLPVPPPPPREPIRIALPVPQLAPTGELVVQPNVGGGAGYTLTDGGLAPAAWPPGAAGVAAAMMQASDTLPPPPPPGALQWPGESAPAAPFAPAAPLAPGNLPVPSLLPEGIVSGEPSDLFWGAQEPLVPWDSLGVLGRRQISPSGQPGLGRERVMFAPFFIDITQPFGNFTLRNDVAWHLTRPDRAEYFWAMPGRGPARPEKSVSYQDYRFRLEMGGPAFSVATDIPVRFVDPIVNGNNGGIGDISLVTKTRLMDGSRWQMTQILRTIFNSGNARKGLGTGHVAMEPGLLCRYKVSDITFIHSEFELRFPLGGTPMYSGPGFTWGVGISTIWWETDTFAAMPTLEFVNLWILDGQYTPYPGGAPIDVRGDSINNLAPGMRMVWDTGGDLGVVEFGVSSSIGLGSNGWYNSLLRADLRFVF
jgi:hypothetical protein